MEFVQCEKKKNNNKKKKKKKKKKKRTRTNDNENNKVHFFAKFSNVGDWCRSMREDGKAESGVRLSASKKVADLVLANNCENAYKHGCAIVKSANTTLSTPSSKRLERKQTKQELKELERLI